MKDTFFQKEYYKVKWFAKINSDTVIDGKTEEFPVDTINFEKAKKLYRKMRNNKYAILVSLSHIVETSIILGEENNK